MVECQQDFEYICEGRLVNDGHFSCPCLSICPPLTGPQHASGAWMPTGMIEVEERKNNKKESG